MRNCLRTAFIAALALCSASAFSGQYYDGYGAVYGRGYAPAPQYDRYASRPNDYECVPVSQGFVSTLYRSVRLKKNKTGSPSNVRYTPFSIAVGYIHTMQKLQIGGAFNFESGTRKLRYPDGSSFKTRNRIPGFSGFATYRPFADGTYISGSAFLGFASYKGKDAWPGGGGDTEYRTLFSTGVEAGRTWTFGPGLQLTPHVGLDITYAPSERYHFNLGRAEIDSQMYFEFPFGATLRKTFNCGAWLITPKADLTFTPSLGSIDPRNAHPGFSYRIADKWKVVGASGSNFGARITLGAEARLRERIAFGLEYIYEGRSKYSDHRLATSFNLAF